MSEPVITKRCSNTKIEKPLTEFYKDRSRADGHQCPCKICQNEVFQHYRKTPQRKLAVKRYTESPNGKITRSNYSKSPQSKAYHQRYRNTDECRATQRIAQRNYRRKYRDRAKATRVLRYQIEKGLIPPASNFLCLRCERQAQDYHHHLGYAPEHRLDVVPLCKPCHRHIHLVKQLSFS